MATRKKKATAPTKSSTDARATLLAEVIRSPDDVQARLVYADLLQQEDDPRGELITLQCARADLPDGDARIAELEKREKQLLDKNKKSWSAFAAAPGARWTYERGFASRLGIDAAAFARSGAMIFATEPVEKLGLWKVDACGGALAEIFELEALERLTELSLARNRLELEDVDALCKARTLRNVITLDLTGCMIGAEGATLLARSRAFPRLVELRVGTCALDDEGVAALAASQTLAPTTLGLARNALHVEGATRLAEARFAGALRELDLSSNDLFDDGMRALLAEDPFPALRSLKLEYCGFSEAIVDEMLASPMIERLELLDVTSSFGAAEVDRLRQRFGASIHPVSGR